MNYLFYAILFLFVLWMLYRQFAPVKGLRTLSAEQFQSESKGKKVIDVREIHEYNRGHIKGAINIPLSQLQQRMGEITKDQAVYVYCQSGMRSKQAAKLLGRHGIKEVADLRGGIMSWSGPTQK
ncbi:rhodanese-like domain-containing protein [Paenibacillus sp. J53TS2]|uniref:rhodanese-like domain-containing protein n=1 Tax=Paenibacillus sp. J53TS2 TaxID=2807197 RepID=UPI001B275D3F|nr:rhodanese-like domain-containing protein [Paenibacillus sp. J53TS2]GIP50632.1 rhodanese-like domain-containing protein [Paenibacillus sp. J53TS2]